MSDNEEERTEDATDQRREDFRKRGQVAYTRELGSVFLLFGLALALWAMGRFFLTQFIDVLTHSLTDAVVVAARQGDYKEAVSYAAIKGVMVVAPLLMILGILAVMSSVVQTGLLNNEEALSPDFNRLNPIEGFKKIFSMRALIEGLKSVIKVSTVLFVSYSIIRRELVVLPFMLSFDLQQVIVYVGGLALKLLGGVGTFMLVLAAADYFFQRWDLEKRMRMTKQEIKEEHKSSQGDPLIKSRIRRMQREVANRRMMDEIPKADVVITNPTHLAVVLKYDANMIAPQLVAKGADLVAEKIKAIAREHNIPIVENKPLARTIFKTLKIGQGIPRELFTAVAQVLSYVYRLKKKVIR